MITIFTDGATEGHNGKLGTVTHCGIGFYCPEKNFKFSHRIEAISNNEAEFYALIEAMKWALENNFKEVQFFLDSMIVVNRANNKNRSRKNARMNNFQSIVLNLSKNFNYISFEWIPRERNTEADKQSKLAVTPTNPYEFYC